jgi:hypothetical protein
MYLTDMITGRHDAGTYDVMIFLGDNFYETGLNIPADDVPGRIKSVLGPYEEAFAALGKTNVHAIPGNHDYYLRNALEKSLLFGLINISEGPIGLTDKGNKREAEIEYWTYYHHMPGHALYPIAENSRDSVQLVFFDSALLLRTDPARWRPALDSLRRLLGSTVNRPGIRWRILSAHHPFHSLGEHAGYSEWDEEDSVVAYLTRCDKDSNAVGWIKNWLDPEDLCAEKYRQYVDSVKTVIDASGAKVQVILSGHDHSLQLLYYPGKVNTLSPQVQIVSGAGARPTRVRFPVPPNEYTASQTKPEKEGYSLPGFVQFRFTSERLRVVFFNSRNGDPIDMGGGKEEFWIGLDGKLLSE